MISCSARSNNASLTVFLFAFVAESFTRILLKACPELQTTTNYELANTFVYLKMMNT